MSISSRSREILSSMRCSIASAFSPSARYPTVTPKKWAIARIESIRGAAVQAFTAE
ncbi:hypothetical protein AB0C90_00375 [Streptomyces sp. NPDC048550]|uniref:hypothetical protein n=1 Tax=Streptomyces sp. NPDC048550 TaxID=3155739 RepID=UPI00342615F7